MIELPIYNLKGKKADTLSIDEQKLGSEVRPALLKQAYVMFHSNLRQGSARTKSRGMVSGSTRKLYRQKGTGNARAGSARTVIRKGGGVAFAKNKTHAEFRKSMPKRMRRLANKNALLSKLVDGEVKCIESLAMESVSTSEMRKIHSSLGINRTCLMAVDPKNINAILSARNLEDVQIVRPDQLNVFDLLNNRFLIIEKHSLELILDNEVSRGVEREVA